MASRAKLGIVKKITFTFVALAILAVVAELGWRTYLGATGRGFFDDPREFTSPFFTTYEEPLPRLDGDRLIYRNGAVARSKPDDEIRVLCLGGSTTVNTRAGISYPELLEQRFAERRGNGAVRVLNAGGEGFSSAHSLVNLALRNLDAAPDVVVVYHNINDLSACWFGEGVTSDYAAKYRSDFYLGFRHRTGVAAGIGKVSRLARFLFSKVSAIAFPAQEQRAELPHDQGLVYFRRNLRSIAAIAKAHGIRLVLASQPARSTFRNHPGFRAYNEATATVARELGVTFVDVAGAMTEDTLFLEDAIHYTPAGVEALRDALYGPLAGIVEDVERGR